MVHVSIAFSISLIIIVLMFSANLVIKFIIIIFLVLYSCPARPLLENNLPLN